MFNAGSIQDNMNITRTMTTLRQDDFYFSFSFLFSFFPCKVKWNFENCLPQIHFRRDHYLCEDEACLAKKFIVFQSEAEVKVTSWGIEFFFSFWLFEYFLSIAQLLLFSYKVLIFLFLSFQRHNTIEHGGHMSRAQRSAALQVCIILLINTPHKLSFP